MGYSRAGFSQIVGVDIEHMRDYPFEFCQADALEFLFKHGQEFDVIHASPPCQVFSAMQHIWANQSEHDDLVEPVRDLLIKTGKPYIIENVNGAPLGISTMLCGTMFGLRIIRHRYFETSFLISALNPPCDHRNVYDPWHGKKNATKFREAMGVEWMRDVGGGKRKGTVSQAIPPAYTEWIGRQFIAGI